MLAVVGDSTITVAAFLAEFEQRGGAANFATRKARRELLDDMIRLQLLAAAARAAGYDAETDFRRESHHLLAGLFRQRHLEPELARVGIDEAEIAEYYRRNRDRYLVPAAIRLAALFFEYPDAVSDEARLTALARARTVRDQILEEGIEERFAVLAARHSDDQATRYRGGDQGWLTGGEIAERWGADVAAAIAALDEVGAVSEPIGVADGVYLFRVIDSQPATWTPLAQVQSAIRHELSTSASREIRDRFFASLEEEIRVEVDEARLAAVEIPSPARRPELRPPPVPQI